MHVWTHLSPRWQNKSGFGLFADGMMELDYNVGRKFSESSMISRIADNTIVIFTSDNGAEIFSWPDGGMVPFKGEESTTFEGGFRRAGVYSALGPAWSKPGIERQRHRAPRGLDADPPGAAGEPDVKEKLLTGMKAGEKTFKESSRTATTSCPSSRATSPKGPRKEFFYFDDQRKPQCPSLRGPVEDPDSRGIEGNLFTGKRTSMNVPLVVNLRMDPFERTPFRVRHVSPVGRRQAVDPGPGVGHCGEVHPVVQGFSAEPAKREHESRCHHAAALRRHAPARYKSSAPPRLFRRLR